MQFQELENKDSFITSITIPGTSATTSGNYGYVLTARLGVEVIGVAEKHETAGSDGGAVTLDVVKVPNGSAISAGTSILASTFNLKSTANTNVYKEGKNLTTTRFGRTLEPNESIGLRTSGTLTAVAGVHVCIYYRPVNQGSYR